MNSHAAAVVPGMGISVSTVLSELERQPGEFIVDPWVSEGATLVAEQRDRVAAAAVPSGPAQSRRRQGNTDGG